MNKFEKGTIVTVNYPKGHQYTKLNGLRGVVVKTTYGNGGTLPVLVDFGVAYERFHVGGDAYLHNFDMASGTVLKAHTGFWFNPEELLFADPKKEAEFEKQQTRDARFKALMVNDLVMVDSKVLRMAKPIMGNAVVGRIARLDSPELVLIDFGRFSPVDGHTFNGLLPTGSGWLVGIDAITPLYE